MGRAGSNLNSTRPLFTWSPSHVDKGETRVLKISLKNTGSTGFEPGTHAWLSRQSGALGHVSFSERMKTRDVFIIWVECLTNVWRVCISFCRPYAWTLAIIRHSKIRHPRQPRQQLNNRALRNSQLELQTWRNGSLWKTGNRSSPHKS